MMLGNLPGDLVEEILCRVPATSLKRLRSTCKLWNRLFNDVRFARKHSDKAAKQYLKLMVTKEFRLCPMSVSLHHGTAPSVKVKGKLSLLDPHFSTQMNIYRGFHCDGLLLCSFGDELSIVVWNPLTGETRWINTDTHCMLVSRFVLGYYHQDKKSCNKSYKILSFDYTIKVTQIYDFSSDHWRILDDDIAQGWFLYFTYIVVSFKGNTYWFAKNETEKQLGVSLLRFDFSTERFEPVPLPYQYRSYQTVNISTVRDEKLSVLLQPEITSKAEIWVTNKIDDETNMVVSWSKILVLDLSFRLEISVDGSFLLDEERWVDFGDKRKSMDTIYIVGEDNKVTSVDFGVEDEDTMDLCLPSILNYAPSLVQIE